jgi:multiple sugar transport system substrate-binding protein
MKKLTVVLLVLLIPAMIFAGGKKEADTGVTTIRYSFWGNPDAIGVEQDIIDAFEAENPDIKVEPVVVGYGDYHSRLFTLIAGGSTPDVMRIDSYYIQDFVEADVLETLDPYIQKAGIDLDLYYRQGIVENRFNGNMYGLPWGTAPIYMILNLDVFEKNGIPRPAMNWSVEEFRKVLESFRSIPNTYGFAWTLGGVSGFYPFMWSMGGDIFSEDLKTFTLDKPEAYKAIQFMADLYRDGLLPKDIITADFGMIDRWFLNGNVGIVMGAASVILSYQKTDARFEAWPMPIGITEQTTMVKSNTVGIAKDSKEKDAAWRFLEFLRGTEGKGESLYMQAKRIPPTIMGDKYWDLYADTEKYPKMIQEVTEAISDRFGRGMRIRSGMYEVEQIVLPEIQRIFLGEITAEAAMKAIAPAAQAVLDRN